MSIYCLESLYFHCVYLNKRDRCALEQISFIQARWKQDVWRPHNILEFKDVQTTPAFLDNCYNKCVRNIVTHWLDTVTWVFLMNEALCLLTAAVETGGEGGEIHLYLFIIN